MWNKPYYCLHFADEKMTLRDCTSGQVYLRLWNDEAGSWTHIWLQSHVFTTRLFICKAYTIISLCYNLDKGCGYVCAQSCLTLCDPMDCSLSGSSVHGIFAGKNTEWVAMPFSRGSSQHRDQSHVSCVFCIAGGFLTHWGIREAQDFICVII